MLTTLLSAVARFYAWRALHHAGTSQVSVPTQTELATAALRAEDLAYVAQLAADARDWNGLVLRTCEARDAARTARALSHAA